MEPDEQDEVRDALDAYVRAYSFLSQVVEFGDVGLEALYLASRALARRAARPTAAAGSTSGSEVELTHLRLEKTSEGSITPEHGGSASSSRDLLRHRASRSRRRRRTSRPSSRSSTSASGSMLGTADQLFFDQLEETWMADEHLVAQARANPIENFRLVFSRQFLKSIVGRMDDNEEIFKRVLDDARRSRPR